MVLRVQTPTQPRTSLPPWPLEDTPKSQNCLETFTGSRQGNSEKSVLSLVTMLQFPWKLQETATLHCCRMCWPDPAELNHKQMLRPASQKTTGVFMSSVDGQCLLK